VSDQKRRTRKPFALRQTMQKLIWPAAYVAQATYAAARLGIADLISGLPKEQRWSCCGNQGARPVAVSFTSDAHEPRHLCRRRTG
jgi:hypothetical protein